MIPALALTRRLARHLLLATGLALAAVPALAHDDATLDAMATPNGGQLRMAGAWHLELVLARTATATQEQPVRLFLTDHAGQAQNAQGARASVTLLSGKDKVTVDLRPDGGNRLQGSARYTARPDLKAIVTLTVPGQEPVQARFTPLAATAKPMPAGKDAGAHANHSH